MKYSIELKVSGKKDEKAGDLPLEEVLALGDSMIEKALKESRRE